MRITGKNIIFEDEVMFSEKGTIDAYLCETDEIDKIAGLATKMNYDEDGEYVGHNEAWNVNYYAVYDFVNDSFSVEVSLTLYEEEEKVYKHYDDIKESLQKYTNNNVSSYELELTDDEKKLIFKKFMSYCKKDLKNIARQKKDESFANFF